MTDQRETTSEVDFTCLDCGFTYTGEVHENEPDECLLCMSPNVAPKEAP